MAMGAGKLDQRITFQRYSETPDGGGGVTRAWADLAALPTVWAHVKARAGREAVTEGRMAASFSVFFTIYHRDDITERDRIIWGGTPYNIRGILREGSGQRLLVIEAERGVAG
ncbi:phage head closure protein [Pontitalea aquivivens]|uniref:phage head closure protein n=1 Tax=Pontitalea aquivivens TaxID=3388663 RepID=UPI003970888F